MSTGEVSLHQAAIQNNQTVYKTKTCKIKMNFNIQSTKFNVPRKLVPLNTGGAKMNINEFSSVTRAIISGIGGSGKTTFMRNVFKILGVEPVYIDYELFSRVILPRYCYSNNSPNAATEEELNIISLTALFMYEILVTDLEYLINREDLYEILDGLSGSSKNMQLGTSSSGFTDFTTEFYAEQAHKLYLRWRDGVSIVIDNVKFKDEAEGEKFVTWYTNLGLKDCDRLFILTDPKTSSLLGSTLPIYQLEDLKPGDVDLLISPSGRSEDRILDLMESMTSRINGDPMWVLNTPEEVEVFIQVFKPEIHRDNLNHIDAEYFADKMFKGIMMARYRKMVKAYKSIGVEVRDYHSIDICGTNYDYIFDLARLRTGDSNELYDLYLKYRSGKSLAEVQQFSSYRQMRTLLHGGF